MRYYKSATDNELSKESLTDLIPTTPEAYDAKYGKNDEELEDITSDLDAMKAVAGVPVTTTAPVNEYTDSLRIAAGLK